MGRLGIDREENSRGQVEKRYREITGETEFGGTSREKTNTMVTPRKQVGDSKSPRIVELKTTGKCN